MLAYWFQLLCWHSLFHPWRYSGLKWAFIESSAPDTMKLWHWKSHWKIFTKETIVMITLKYFPLLFKDTEITLKIFKSHWKFSALLISFVPRIFSITLDFQCDFQCHSFERLWGLLYSLKLLSQLLLAQFPHSRPAPLPNKPNQNRPFAHIP